MVVAPPTIAIAKPIGSVIAARSTSAPSQAPSAATSLADDAALLRAAHQALSAGDASRALRLLDEHAARFPASALEPERSAERVFALCAAGRVPAAHDAASAFLVSHPTGPLSLRVASSCGAKKSP
jgi:hypothetical protein